ETRHGHSPSMPRMAARIQSRVRAPIPSFKLNSRLIGTTMMSRAAALWDASSHARSTSSWSQRHDHEGRCFISVRAAHLAAEREGMFKRELDRNGDGEGRLIGCSGGAGCTQNCLRGKLDVFFRR